MKEIITCIYKNRLRTFLKYSLFIYLFLFADKKKLTTNYKLFYVYTLKMFRFCFPIVEWNMIPPINIVG